MASHSLGLMKGKERNIKAVWQWHWIIHKGFMTKGKLLNHETFAGMIASPSLCSGRVLNSSDTLSNSRVTATLAERNRAYVTLRHYWYYIYLPCASRFSWGASVEMGICLSGSGHFPKHSPFFPYTFLSESCSVFDCKKNWTASQINQNSAYRLLTSHTWEIGI